MRTKEFITHPDNAELSIVEICEKYAEQEKKAYAKELARHAYQWGRDNGEGRSDKNFNDFCQVHKL